MFIIAVFAQRTNTSCLTCNTSLHVSGWLAHLQVFFFYFHALLHCWIRWVVVIRAAITMFVAYFLLKWKVKIILISLENFNLNLTNFVHNENEKFSRNINIILTFHLNWKKSNKHCNCSPNLENPLPSISNSVIVRENEQRTPEDGLISPKHVVIWYI
jgi:hypothetical protein